MPPAGCGSLRHPVASLVREYVAAPGLHSKFAAAKAAAVAGSPWAARSFPPWLIAYPPCFAAKIVRYPGRDGLAAASVAALASAGTVWARSPSWERLFVSHPILVCLNFYRRRDWRRGNSCRNNKRYSWAVRGPPG